MAGEKIAIPTVPSKARITSLSVSLNKALPFLNRNNPFVSYIVGASEKRWGGGGYFVVGRRISLWAREHPLVVYFVLAYAISGAIVAPLIASAQGFTDVPVPFALHYLNDYGPLLAALVAAGLNNGTEGLRDLLQRILRWNVGLG
jgi:hypothetical protein